MGEFICVGCYEKRGKDHKSSHKAIERGTHRGGGDRKLFLKEEVFRWSYWLFFLFFFYENGGGGLLWGRGDHFHFQFFFFSNKPFHCNKKNYSEITQMSRTKIMNPRWENELRSSVWYRTKIWMVRKTHHFMMENIDIYCLNHVSPSIRAKRNPSMIQWRHVSFQIFGVVALQTSFNLKQQIFYRHLKNLNPYELK